MTCLILLAAGRGSRLQSLTSQQPKCLNSYKGESLISRIIQIVPTLESYIDRVIVIGGYKGELIKSYGDVYLENTDWYNSGPFWTLLYADSILSSEECIVSYTDIYYDKSFLNACLESKDPIFLPSNANFRESWLLRNIDVLEDLESFKYRNNRIEEIGKRPKSVNEVQGQFSGIFKTTPEGWFALKTVAVNHEPRRLDMTTAFSHAIDKGVIIKCSQVYAMWKEFDIPTDFVE